MAKPTPTQDELDRAAMGEHVIDKEHDGSEIQNPPPEPVPPEPDVPPDHPDQGLPGARRKQMEAKPASASGGYQTRQATPTQPQPKPTTE